MRIWSVLVAMSLALSCAGVGCRLVQSRRTMPAIAMLDSADWMVRQRAAVALAEGAGPPAEAVPPLYRAMFKERNPQVYGAMLIAIGASGIAEARPLIDARINDPDGDMQQWARTALKRWLVANSLMDPQEELPPPPHRLYGPATPPPDSPASKPTPGLEGRPL